MADPQDFFDDPEFLAALQRSGISPDPGTALSLMNELAPLLRADGIDLHDPSLDLSDSEVQAAMIWAIEQHNLRRFTPVGRDRANAITYARLIADLLGDNDVESALYLLSTIGSEDRVDVPVGSHLMGVCLGLIDTWLVGAAAGQVLPVIPVPKWRGHAGDIAQEFIAFARQGHSFERSGSFTAKHTGEIVMHGAVLASAAVVIAVARRDDASVARAFEGLVFASETPGAAPVAYRALDTRTEKMRASAASHGARFAERLATTAESADQLEDMVDEFRLLEVRGLARRLDIHFVIDILELMSALDRAGEGPEQKFSFIVLREYAKYRDETADESDDWCGISDMLGDRIRQYEIAEAFHVPGQDLLQNIVDRGFDTPSTQVDAALDGALMMRGTTELLAWLEKPRPVTGTGGVRRVDIARVAQMIGVRAEGVAKLPPIDPEDLYDPDHVFLVRSMFQVPGLGFWWSVLIKTEVIALTSGRVHRGPVVQQDGSISRETRLLMGARFVEEFTLFRVQKGGDSYFIDLCYVVSQLLIACLHDGIELEQFAVAENGTLMMNEGMPVEVQRLDHHGRHRLLDLERMGLLERTADRRMRVVPALRAAVAQGLDAALVRFKGL